MIKEGQHGGVQGDEHGVLSIYAKQAPGVVRDKTTVRAERGSRWGKLWEARGKEEAGADRRSSARVRHSSVLSMRCIIGGSAASRIRALTAAG